MADIANYIELNAPASGTLVHQISVEYTFAADGGAAGTYTMLKINEAMLVYAIYGVCAGLTSGGSATVAINVGGGPVIPAVAYGDANSNGLKVPLQLTEGTPNTGVMFFPLKAQANADIDLVIGTAALTAGTIKLYALVGPV